MQGIVFMASSADILRQRLPAQDLTRLSLVSHQPKKLKEWVAALPMINVGETSRQVFQTLQEINRLHMDAAARFELLEILRPTVHTLGNALAKHYLNQSVMLPDRATKVATLAQAMQSHLANGYKLVVVAGLDRLDHHKRDVELMKLCAQAIHRAITELTGNLLRSTQLYLNTPPRLWLELHSLYLLAVGHQLATALRVVDSVSQRQVEKSSIEEAYKRTLLLATCKPNKLRQSEIAQIYQLGEIWAPLVELREFGSGELFVFDLSRDAPPTYRTLAQASEAAHVRAIDPTPLVERLNELRVIAHLAEDPGLINAFESGQDIHSATAASIFGVDPGAITVEQRSKAKMVSYGLAYGMEAYGLAQRLSIGRAEAADILDAYFVAFPNVRTFMDRVVNEARDRGYTETEFGRRRLIPELNSPNRQIRSAAERQAMNAPIQGLAADIFKVALVRLDAAIAADGLSSQVVLQVHDEVILEVPPAETDAARELTVKTMREAATLRVGLEVNVTVGDTWASAKG